MGRPLKKDVRGTNVIRSFTRTGGIGNETDPVLNQPGIRVQGYFGNTLASDYQIVKQRGKSTYVVVRTDDDEFTDEESQGSLTGTQLQVGELVEDEPAANGEIRIQGSTTGLLDQNLVAIAKITKRIATDFSGNRYTWFLDNDSSGDVLTLTAV